MSRKGDRSYPIWRSLLWAADLLVSLSCSSPPPGRRRTPSCLSAPWPTARRAGGSCPWAAPARISCGLCTTQPSQHQNITHSYRSTINVIGSVGDPVHEDPYRTCFRPPGSGSGSVSHEVRIQILLSSSKNSKKNIDSFPTVLWLPNDFLSWNYYVNVPSKSNKQKNLGKNSFLMASWRSRTKIAGSGSGSGSIGQRQRSADPDLYLYQNVMDLQHFYWQRAKKHWENK